MPSLEKRLLSIPFTRGLAQKEDPRFIEPGALLTATNVSRSKANIIQKRSGLNWLNTLGRAPGTQANTIVSLISGKRLARHKGNLLIVGQDQSFANPTQAFGDALWQYDEVAGKPLFIDRMSEVHKLPEQTLSGGDIVAVDMDHAVCNGYRVSVWQAAYFGTNPNAAPNAIYYMVTDARTREVVVPPQEVIPTKSWTHSSSGAFSPKVITCGTNVVLMWVTRGADLGVYAASLDCTQPWVAWLASAKLTTHYQNSFANTPYDCCPVLGNTAEWAFVIQTGTGGEGGSVHITSYRCQVSTLTVISSANLDNAVWDADGDWEICGFAIRADLNNAEMAVAAAWLNAGTNVKATHQIQNWPTMATDYGLAAEFIAAAPGPLVTMGVHGLNGIPLAIGMERVDPLSTALQPVYKVYLSPNGAAWNGAPPSAANTWLPGPSAVALIASWMLEKGPASPSAMVVQANHPRITIGVTLASRVIEKNGIAYMAAVCPSYTQGGYFLLADDAWQDNVTVNVPSGSTVLPVNTYFPMRVVAIMAPRLGAAGAGMFSTQVHAQTVLPHLVSNPFLVDAGDGYETVMAVAESPTLATPAIFTVDFASPRSYQAGEVGPLAVFAGGVPSATDGTRVYELGFPLYPIITNVLAVNSGGQMSNGTYSYIAVFTWRDNAGLEHRSARSVPASVTLASGSSIQSANITIGVCGFTGREKFAGRQTLTAGPQSYLGMQQPVVVRLYRTTAGGGIYYHCDRTDSITDHQYGAPPVGTDQPNFQGGTSGLTTITLFDTNPDTTTSPTISALVSHSLLYGDGSDGTQPGNVLDDLCPPGFQCLVVHQGRIFGVDGNTVWASKVFTEGIAPAFNEALAFTVEDGPGWITALISLDDKLIIAKRDRLFVMTGDGPTDSGGQNNWSAPTRIASDAGVIDWRSVAVTAKGAFFMSDTGRRFLTRDLQVMPVTEVEDLDAVYPAQTSAIVHPSQNRVVWTQNLNDSGSTVGIGIDHDTVLDTWTQRQSQWSQTGSSFASAVVALATDNFGLLQPTYHVLRPDGVVGREAVSPAGYQDGTSYVPMTIDTAWVKADGIEGFGRFRRLMVTWQNNDPHQLSVYVQYDFDPTGNWILLGNVTAAQMAAMQTKLPTVRFQLPHQRAQAVRFRIVDAADALQAPVTGQGPTIVSLGLEVGVYTNRRLARVPGAQVR